MSEFLAQQTHAFAAYVGRQVAVVTDTGAHFTGTLLSYDLYGNLVLDGAAQRLSSTELAPAGVTTIQASRVQFVGLL
ncbi:LSM domain-containing protein [Spironucleus salmonicida]|uniref:LSM domain-containing protein n=1 Tax=Spironucleus salmonicida TaxID=348837 RepID=V6LP17_9EUKA|nr:LSM domain-containing protein [Spironucleus salmonicida]KAH0576229.1 LSM domain-containing protein [Spironucleus salmonicida]|eukprot:EST45461.1 LSM domain-containing protein [Spironucleus salmonicida]